MAKRLTDSEKWKKQWFRKLPLHLKCFWFYILDSCNHAGIWDVDYETASYFIGKKITENDIENYFYDHLVLINEKKIFIVDYNNFQYGSFNKNVKAHKSAIDILNKYNLLNDDLTLNLNSCLRVREELDNRLITGMDMDKDKDKNKDKDKKKGCLILPEYPKIKLTKKQLLKLKEKMGGGDILRIALRSYHRGIMKGDAPSRHRSHYDGLLDYYSRGFFEKAIAKEKSKQNDW